VAAGKARAKGGAKEKKKATRRPAKRPAAGGGALAQAVERLLDAAAKEWG
jgi:hypothetical protein